MATPFEKDFGYLMPFLDKIDGAAKALSDPTARAEAIELVTGERERWSRLRELLAGAAGNAQGRSSETAQPAPSHTGPASAPRSTESRGSFPAFTVGRLKNNER